MKKTTLLLLVCLFSLLAKAQVPVNINSGDPNFPFPQFLNYKVGKNLATDPAPGITHADMEKGIRETYQIMMNRATYSSETVAGVKYIIFNPNTITGAGPQYFCSEGDGYALIAAALLGDKKTFDGLFMATHDYKFKKVKRFIDCVNQGVNYLPNPLPGVYDRKIDEVATNTTGEASDGGTHDSAADGDWDIAMGLVLGARQWGEKSGIVVCGQEINYRKEALTMMKALTDTLKAYQNLGSSTAGPTGKYYSGNIGFDGYAKSGNTFGEMTNWATTSGFGKPKFTGPSSQFYDYMGSGYYQVFADFLEEEKQLKNTNEYDWAIFQFKRARASTNWLLEKTYNDGYLPYVGGVSLTPANTLTYDTYPTSTTPIGEDFRLPWRNLADLLWHGTPNYVWDPVTHQIKSGTTSALAGHAKNITAHLNKPSTKSGDGCVVLGGFPGVFASVDGPMVVAQGVSKTGATMGQIPQTRGMNWIHGVSSAAPIIAEDVSLAAYMYQQCEIEWDATPSLDATAKNDPRRYEQSTPIYFHEFFRLLGMLTLSGNYYPPNEIASKANVKTYVSIDKTFGFPKDEVKYVVKYRNYGSANATNVNVKFDIPVVFDVISTSKGTVSGNSISFATSLAGVKNGLISIDSIVIKVKVRTDAQNGRYCSSATVSGTGFETHTSSEYPNNATYTMERNCFDIVTRSLNIKKSADKEFVNPGDVVTYNVDFENSSKAGWLDGGRPGVKFTYGQNINSSDSTKVTKFDIFLRIGHGAHESYINLKNYRVSYYLNETAIDKVVTDKTKLGWYLGTHHYYVGDDIDKMTLSNQIIPYGQLANGKKWNQRLIFKFSEDVISAPTMHLFQQTNNFHRIHKGTGYPFIAYLQMETAGLSLNYGDDWSFDNKNAVPNEKDANVSIVLPDNSDPYNKDVMDKKFNPYACSELGKYTSKILVEEFDGYGWRRILGNGPVPGREAENVVVIDSLPKEVKWGGFNTSKAIGIDATYDPACHCITWKKDALLVAEKGKIEYWVTVKNASEMGKSCPLEIDMINKASISALSESPLVATSTVHITCGALPPPKPSKTSMYKTADKAAYAIGDKVTYTVAYKQTQGTIAKPNLLTNSDWTVSNSPTFSSQGISFGGNSEYARYDYSHGTNGVFDLELEITNASSVFSVLLRNNTGSPKTTPFTGVGFQVHPGPWGMDKGAIISVLNGTTIVAETDGFKPYDATSTLGVMKIHIELIDDVMRIWINKDYTVDAPTLSASGLNLQAGYLAYYNDKIVAFKDNRAFGGSGPGIKVKSWNSNFDSAFEVKLWDEIPAELAYVASSAQKVFTSVGFTPQVAQPTYNGATKKVEWSLKTGKTPMLYGDSVVMKFESTVLNCGPGFITNTAYVDVLGQPLNKIGSQSVVTCGTPTTCIKPTSITISDKTACAGEAISVVPTVAGTATLDKYFYSWKKPGITTFGTASAIVKQLDIASLALADSGQWVLRVEDGNNGTATCYTEKTFKVTVNSKPSGTFVLSAPASSCKDSIITVTISGGKNARDYKWTLPTGMTFNSNDTVGLASTSAKIKVSAAGTISVTPTSICGDFTSALTKTISLNPLPTTIISNTIPDSVCSNTAKQMTFEVKDATSYKWEFGSTLLAGTTKTNTLNVTTSDTLKVTPINACGNGPVYKKFIKVNTIPTGSITENIPDTAICPNSSLAVTVAQTGATSYKWEIGTTEITPITTSSSKTLAIGTSNFTLNVTPSNTCGTGTKFTQLVQVKATCAVCTPPSDAKITANDTLCTSKTGTLTANVESGYQYDWYNVTTGTPAPLTNGIDKITQDITTGGKYAVLIYQTGYGNNPSCIKGDTITVTEITTPTGTLNLDGNFSFCPNSKESYTLTSLPSATDYRWTLPTVATLTTDTTGKDTKAIEVQYGTTLATNAELKVVAVNSCGEGSSESVSLSFLSKPTTPTIDGRTNKDEIPVCIGTTLSLTGKDGITYKWNSGTGQTQEGLNDVFDHTVSTNTWISLKSVGSCGESDSIYVTLKTQDKPVTAAITGANSTCAGATETYQTTAVPNADSYVWTVGATTQLETSNSLTTTLGTTSTVIKVKAVSTLCGDGNEESFPVSITTNAIPVINITQKDTVCEGGNTTFEATVSNAGTTPTYEWSTDNGANFSPGTKQFTLASSTNQQIQARLTSDLSCVAAADKVQTSATHNVVTDSPAEAAVITTPSTPTLDICVNNTSVNAQAATYGKWEIPSNATVGTPSSNQTTVSNINNNDPVIMKWVVGTEYKKCLPNEATVTITKSADITPAAITSHTNNEQICINTLLTFGGNKTSTETERWKVNNLDLGNSNAFTPTSAGNITVSYIKSVTGGCSDSTGITLTVFEAETTVDFTLDKNQDCEGKQIFANITTPKTDYIYTWNVEKGSALSATSGNTTTITLGTGITSENVTVNSVHSVCPQPVPVTATKSITVNQVPKPTGSEMIVGNATPCENATESYSLANPVIGATGYVWTFPTGWSGTTQTTTPETNTTVGNSSGTITLKAINNCAPSGVVVATKTITVSTTQIPTVSIVFEEKAYCENNLISFKALVQNGTATAYKWFVNDVEQVGETTEEYYNVVTPNSRLQVSASYTTCDGTPAETAKSDIVTPTINVKPTPVLGYQGNVISEISTKDICENDAFVFAVTGIGEKDNISWTVPNNAQINTSQSKLEIKKANSTHTGYYEVNVTREGCSSVSSQGGINLEVHTQPRVEFVTKDNAPTDSYVYGEEETPYMIYLFGKEFQNGTFTLTPEGKTKTFGENTNEKGSYEVLQIVADKEVQYVAKVTTGPNELCVAKDSAKVLIVEKLRVPSAFTPNGDGKNDTWIIGGMEKYPKAKVMIFSRWGEKLYDHVGLYNSEPWTGEFKGEKVPAGTYYYIIELNDISAQENLKKGTVTIVE